MRGAHRGPGPSLAFAFAIALAVSACAPASPSPSVTAATAPAPTDPSLTASIQAATPDPVAFEPTYEVVDYPEDVVSQSMSDVECGYLTVLEDRSDPAGAHDPLVRDEDGSPRWHDHAGSGVRGRGQPRRRQRTERRQRGRAADPSRRLHARHPRPRPLRSESRVPGGPRRPADPRGPPVAGPRASPSPPRGRHRMPGPPGE